jgi:hypothetical protein
MVDFVIVEIEDGLTALELQPDESPEAAAVRAGGTLVDPGPYPTYDAACDALDDLQYEGDEERA